jgi:hypothetical protein
MRYTIYYFAICILLISCNKDEKCTEFTPYDFEQKLQLTNENNYSSQELALLHSYFEKYRIRVKENAKDIVVKDKKFALIEAKFPITTNFCDAIEAEKAFNKTLKAQKN